ncbi:unnamed protein product, partial [Discosporangium mesarthrocarpum]
RGEGTGEHWYFRVGDMDNPVSMMREIRVYPLLRCFFFSFFPRLCPRLRAMLSFNTCTTRHEVAPYKVQVLVYIRSACVIYTSDRALSYSRYMGIHQHSTHSHRNGSLRS